MAHQVQGAGRRSVAVYVEVRIDASPQRVWEVISDHEGMSRWGGIRESRLLQKGSPDPNGAGAVRVLRAPGQEIHERITAWEPPRRYEYTLLRGAPVRDHHGSLEIVEEGGGARVVWRTAFNPRIPGTGWLMKKALGLGLKRMLLGAKKLCESGAPTGRDR